MPHVAAPTAPRKLSREGQCSAVITVHPEPVDLGIPGFVPAPLVVVRVGPPEERRPRRPPRQRIDSRQLVRVPVRRVMGAYRAPRRRRIARSGSRVGGGLDPPGPGNGTAALDARAAADQDLPKWDLGNPPNSPPRPAAQADDGDDAAELIGILVAKLAARRPPLGEAWHFWRHAADRELWVVDKIALATTAERYPTRGSA
jgi:hypothetical protein